MFEFNSKDPAALNYSGTLVPCSIKRREKKRRERKILDVRGSTCDMWKIKRTGEI